MGFYPIPSYQQLFLPPAPSQSYLKALLRAHALGDALKQAPRCFAVPTSEDLINTQKKREVNEQAPSFFLIIINLDNNIPIIILAGFICLEKEGLRRSQRKHKEKAELREQDSQPIPVRGEVDGVSPPRGPADCPQPCES